MRFKVIVVLLLVLGINSILKAQISTLIKGELSDTNRNKIPYGTIALYQAKDSFFVKATVSNESGLFELPVFKSGNYYIVISSTGFENLIVRDISISVGESKNLGRLILSPASVKLTEVIVQSRKPMIEIKGGRTIFNVEYSPSATGSNGLELLQKSPGVFVDNNENISIKGKTGITVFIDKRPLLISGQDLASFLKGINSADVESIEIITNPGAEYDASGNGGVIQIKTKKDKRVGVNGTLNFGIIQGITLKGNSSLSMNYRSKRVNLFGSLNTSRGVINKTMDLTRKQGDTLYQHEDATEAFTHPVNFKLGLDWTLSPKSSLGLLINSTYTDYKNSIDGYTDITYNPTNQYVKKLLASNFTPGYKKLASGNINYRFENKNGFQFNTDFDYGNYYATGRSFQPNYYYSASGVGLYQVINSNYTPINIDYITGKVDFQQPLFNGDFSYGLKIADVKTAAIFDFFVENAGIPEKVLSLSNFFSYKESVKAGYINFQKKYNDNLEFALGLRMEHTKSLGNLSRADGIVQPDNLVERKYLNIFPNLNLSWSASDNHTFSFGISRRIDRPNYRDLNPFENKLDELTYEKGNAFLQPQYSNQVEVSYQFKKLITAEVSYSHVSGWSTTSTDSVRNAAYVQPRNMEYQKLLTVAIASSHDITKWWRGYVNFWFRHQSLKGIINYKEAKVNVPVYGFNFQESFSLGKGYTAELSGFYKGKDVWGGTWNWKPYGSLDFGLQKQIMKKSGTLKLAVTDIFFTNNFRGINDFNGLYVNSYNTRETRTLRLSFSYRFGNTQVKSNRNRSVGSEQEVSRIN